MTKDGIVCYKSTGVGRIKKKERSVNEPAGYVNAVFHRLAGTKAELGRFPVGLSTV